MVQWYTVRFTSNSHFFSKSSLFANILIAGGEQKSDFENLLNAARKAVSHGFRVFILPNPKGVRSADFILERKGLYKMYEK